MYRESKKESQNCTAVAVFFSRVERLAKVEDVGIHIGHQSPVKRQLKLGTLVGGTSHYPLSQLFQDAEQDQHGEETPSAKETEKLQGCVSLSLGRTMEVVSHSIHGTGIFTYT